MFAQKLRDTNVQKETLTLEGIVHDLTRLVKWQPTDILAYRLGSILIGTTVAVAAIWLRWWVAVLVLLFPLYHIVRAVLEYRVSHAKRRAVQAIRDRRDISIARVKLNAITEESVYAPHGGSGLRGPTLRYHRLVTVFHFSSGAQFRVPPFKRHYEWSPAFYITSKGLQNVSSAGEEFYYVSLQGHYDVAYIYPCERFDLDKSLET